MGSSHLAKGFRARRIRVPWQIRLAWRCAFLWALSLPLHAGEPLKDYRLEAAVYQWYGALDSGTLFESGKGHKLPFTLPEYQGTQGGGAHHILAITPLLTDTPIPTAEPQANSGSPLRASVSLEFLPPSPGDMTRGHYLEVTMHFDAALALTALTTEAHEQDDFDSRFRPSADSNLIRALIYRWTAQLDSPGTPYPMGLPPFTQDASFIAPEKGIDNAADYLGYLASLQHQSSRREIKNLILQSSAEPGEYRVSFEYQWRAQNARGEEELSQIQVDMTLVVTNGQAVISAYRERFLPPVTDLGAEIRC